MFSYKLYHNLLQIFIPFQHWAVEYSLIAWGGVLDLKSVTSFWAHLDRLSPNGVS